MCKVDSLVLPPKSGSCLLLAISRCSVVWRCVLATGIFSQMTSLPRFNRSCLTSLCQSIVSQPSARLCAPYTALPLKVLRNIFRALQRNGQLFAVCGTLVLPLVPRMQTLKFRDDGIGDSGVRALCDALRAGAMPQLQQLDLGNCSISESGARSLFDALRAGAVPQLQWLQLSWMSSSVPVSRALSDALHAWAIPRCKHVRFSWCSISYM